MAVCSSRGPALWLLRTRRRGYGFLVAPLGGGSGKKKIKEATQEGAGKGAERVARRAPSPELNCPELRLERGAPSQQIFLGTAPPLVPASGL